MLAAAIANSLSSAECFVFVQGAGCYAEKKKTYVTFYHSSEYMQMQRKMPKESNVSNNVQQ
eukprot:scaffold10716_cov91-Skeletonema_marinoi.AAC.6